MMIVMLVAGIGLVLAGLLAIGFGIPIKEFSTGNTLIVTGVMGVCTGAIMFALWIAVRELRNIARRLGPGAPQARGEATIRHVLPPGESVFPSGWDQPVAPQAGSAPSAPPPPWQDEVVLRDHPIPEPMFPEDTAPPPPPTPKQKRNLLFSSTSRKERERGQARANEPLPPDLSSDLGPIPPATPPGTEPAEPQPPSFEDAWPRPDRTKPGEIPPPRRGLRTPLALDETSATPARNEDQPAVTILKSGIVDGMAYSLYSDGSIEAQMPEGMMRFASIDELRAHLDQRA
jgi:hypothetical protein